MEPHKKPPVSGNISYPEFAEISGVIWIIEYLLVIKYISLNNLIIAYKIRLIWVNESSLQKSPENDRKEMPLFAILVLNTLSTNKTHAFGEWGAGFF